MGALLELQLLTGVKTDMWTGTPDESLDERADRLEFLADVMLGINENENDTPLAAQVASLHRVVLGESVDRLGAGGEAYATPVDEGQLTVKSVPRVIVGQPRAANGGVASVLEAAGVRSA
ncbi:hypothetical protein [Streptomyces antimycoticus]|uniref:hypothetical protein n=1 Tax=Streptomyces antimycoticus TaxID=68175 RepID=UPI0013873FCA|nr:hypothetical protein [Streptomyces antimycoticus]